LENIQLRCPEKMDGDLRENVDELGRFFREQLRKNINYKVKPTPVDSSVSYCQEMSTST
jgi:hypothetical protein